MYFIFVFVFVFATADRFINSSYCVLYLNNNVSLFFALRLFIHVLSCNYSLPEKIS